MTQQTAVEWLVEQFKKQGFLYDLDIEAAKAMEKEQMQDIIDAYVTGRLKDKNIKYGIEYYNKLEDFIDEGEEYYNKTYNNETI